MLLLPLLRPFNYRNFSRWIYTPLLIALGLFVLLIALGSTHCRWRRSTSLLRV